MEDNVDWWFNTCVFVFCVEVVQESLVDVFGGLFVCCDCVIVRGVSVCCVLCVCMHVCVCVCVFAGRRRVCWSDDNHQHDGQR